MINTATCKYLLKKTLVIVYILATLLLSFQSLFTVAFAQSVSSSTSSSSKGPLIITTTASKGIQSIFDNSLPIVLKITTNFDADRLEIEAVYPSANLNLKDAGVRQFTKVIANDTKTYEYTFTPKKGADSNILFKVQAWQNDVNVVDIEEIQVKFDDDLKVVPQSDEYNQNLRNWNTIRLFIVVLALTIVIILGYMFYKSFLVWMSKD